MDPKELREIQINYFHLALQEWETVEDTLRDGWDKAWAAGSIPLLWSEAGGLNEAVEQINTLAVTLRAKVLLRGSLIVRGVQTTLNQVAHNYVISEAQSQQEAEELGRMLSDGS